MPAWFDIRGLGPGSAEDEEGIVKAAAALNHLVDKEIAAGIDPSRIVIGTCFNLWTIVVNVILNLRFH